jgi:16S rRNA (adenine1518-N6/adenine1519-N6)-dimethyltransferase
MARRRLGQHFLFDPSILGRIVDAAGLSTEDTAVEIGPGPGALTRLLAERAKKVVAIELDEELFRRLRIELAGYMNIELIKGDALKFPFHTLGRFKVVSNIPYYITTPIIFTLLDAGRNLETMTLTIQKEVAERIVAAPGGKDYGVLSIMVQYCASPELKFIIPKEAFRPAPRVDSAVVHIEMLHGPRVRVKDEEMFYRVVRTAFSQRRKTLANSLKSFGQNVKDILARCGIDPQRRPETLSLAEFARLADLLMEEPKFTPSGRA